MENMGSVDSPPLTLCNFPPGCDEFLTQLRVYSKRKKILPFETKVINSEVQQVKGQLLSSTKFY